MGTALIVVESPAKAKTIKKYLGKGYQVLASVGHVKDLPKKELGVDIENGFEPKYVAISGKGKVLKQISDAAAKVDQVFLAPDPDREGEAIAWHLADEIRRTTKKKKTPEIHRALFHEITASAIKAALANPQELDANRYEAQQARRILDRLVGYRISPILWDKVKRGLSAGRVQSVAVRIVCEREAEIQAFKAKEYWSIVANVEGSQKPKFEAKLAKIDGKNFEIDNEQGASQTVAELQKQKFMLANVVKKERKKNPTPPFITSKLQQEAARKLGFSAKKTMTLAQMLYQGVELGSEGLVGLITYMRTDSVRSADSAVAEARDFIELRYGKDSVPSKPNFYKTKKSAQDAHEAIRPTSMEYTPEKVQQFLERDLYRLYDLIWKRFVASQMIPAVYDQTTFEIQASEKYLFRSTGQVMRIPGFVAVYMEGEDDAGEKDESANSTLPDLSKGEELKLHKLDPHQHFTQPPPRFTEASLVKILEEKGIGRPSTYAAIMTSIVSREYVESVQKRFMPTELGKLVNELLVNNFPRVLDIGFTAKMEDELDEVEEGKRAWTSALNDFYGPFAENLAKAKEGMRDVKRQSVETKFKCEKCDNVMVIKWGRNGEFLACSTYPECRNTKEFRRTETGDIEIVAAETSDEKCEKCGSPMLVKRGKFGEFLACSKYPDCKSTKSISTGVKCPNKDGGELVQKRSRRGRTFYGCDKYPKCSYATWDKPVEGKCPDCGHEVLVEKYSKKTGETSIACPEKGCGYKAKATD